MTFEIFMPLMYEYCVKIEMMDGNFTFGSLIVLSSVDGCMGDTIHTLHKVWLGLLEVKS